MRIIVTSDSHSRSSSFFNIVEKHIEEAEYFINLGDSNSGDDLENAKLYYKSKLHLECVAGNCDWSSTLPTEKILKAGGKTIFFCHGHTYYVKHGIERLIETARDRKADIALFGHTHIPYHEYIDDIHYFNPGAVEDGNYGIIDITDAGIVCINAKIR